MIGRKKTAYKFCSVAIFISLSLFSFALMTSQSLAADDIDVSVDVTSEGTTPVISGINESNITDDSAEISWTTDVSSQCEIRWGESTSYSDNHTESGYSMNHSYTIDGLDSGTHYHYRIYCTSLSPVGNSSSADHTFDTDESSDSGTPDITGISQSNVTDSSATISWDTDIDAKCKIEWGTSESYDSGSFQESGYTQSHSYEINNLSGSTTYHYKITCEGRNSSDSVSSGDKTLTTSSSGESSSGGTVAPTEFPPPPISPSGGVTPPISVPTGDDNGTSGTGSGGGNESGNETSTLSLLMVGITDAYDSAQVIAAENQKAILPITVAGMAAATIPLLIELTALKDVLVLARNLPIILLASRRKRKDWGIVFSTENGKPIPFATVSVIDPVTGKKLESRLTDKHGAYGFLVPKGTYLLAVEKKDFQFIPGEMSHNVFYARSYRGEKLSFERDGLININIPLRPLVFHDEVNWLERNKFWDVTFAILFYAGFAFSAVNLLLKPNLLNLLILLFYILAAVIKNFALGKIDWGTVEGFAGKREAFTVIRVFDRLKNQMVARTVSDQIGRYFLIVDSGDYFIDATGVGGNYWKSEIGSDAKRIYKEKIILNNIRQ
jgi:hypothetical protein